MLTSTNRLLLVLLLWFAGLGAAAQFAKFAVPFAQVQAFYPDLGAELGWLLSLVSLMGAILGIWAGGLVGSLGARRMLLAGLVLGGLVSIWQAGFPGFSVMLLSRVVEGLSHLAIVVAAPTLIAQISTERYRGAAMALWSTFFGVSFALIAVLGLPIVESHGLGLLFRFHGGFMLAIAAVLAISLKKGDRSGQGRDSERGFSMHEVLRYHGRAYRSPSISAPGIGWLFYTLTFVSLLAILPTRLPEDSRQWVAGLMPLLSIATSLLLVPVLIRFLSGTGTVILGFGCAILVLAMGLLGLQLAVVAAALFAVLGLVQGASFAAVPELNRTVETQALGYGAMAQLGNVGNLTGTPLLLAALGAGGETAVLTLVAALYAAGIGVHVFLAARRDKTR